VPRPAAQENVMRLMSAQVTIRPAGPNFSSKEVTAWKRRCAPASSLNYGLQQRQLRRVPRRGLVLRPESRRCSPRQRD